MNKGKLSFSIGKSSCRESDSLRNIFDSGKDEKDTEECDSMRSDNFHSISTTFEYNKSLNFYSQHPELLEDFEKRPEELREQENKELEKKDETGKARLGKSKYLDRIKEHVELRNIEIQEIQEEKIQKEVQEDNAQVFITDAYKDVLEERRKLKDSLTRRKILKDENSEKTTCNKSSGPLSIFEMRFSSGLDETQNEESEAQATSEEPREVLDEVRANPTETPISGEKSLVIDDKTIKTSQNLKQIKIEQARERYLLRKQMREKKSYE